MNLKKLLENAATILVIDWPAKEVPQALARAGFRVVVKGGPGAADFSAYELSNGELAVRHMGCAPERADLVYSYRPLAELPEIVAAATRLRARTIWTQSGLAAAGVNDPRGCWLPPEELQWAKNLVESAGLAYIWEPYILDAV